MSSVPVISHSTCSTIPELVRCRPCQSYHIILAVPFKNSFGAVRASHITFYLQCHSRTRSVPSVPVISHSTCSVIPELVRCRPCQSYRILLAVPFQNSFGVVRASHIAFYLLCHSRTCSVQSVPVISHSTCSAIPELVRCRPCQSYRILPAVSFQNSFGAVRASHIAFYLQCHSRTRSVQSVPVISHSTCSVIPELVRCRPCQSYHILLAVSFQNSFGAVRASHIAFYLQCHSRTRSVPSVPVISHSTCSAIPELVRCSPCQPYRILPAVPFQNLFGAVRASHIAFYLQCHSITCSVQSVPVISHSTCSAITELVRCSPCQSYRILPAVPFQNLFGTVRVSHIAFYLQCHSRTCSVSSVPVISHSTCSAITELVRCHPCQSYHILLAVSFQNSFGTVRASHIALYLQCHSRTRSVPSVPVISHSTCIVIPKLVQCRPCQSYRILLAVPFQNSFGAARASHITFYLQCHSRTRSVSSVPVISHSTCSVIPELVRCRPCQSYHILLAVSFQNSFGTVRASHIALYLQCHSRTRSVPSVPVISHSTCSVIPKLVQCRPCQSYRILLAVPFQNSFGAARASHITFFLQCHSRTRSVSSVPVISHSTCSVIPELVRCRPCQSYHILLAVPFHISFGVVCASHIAFYLQCDSRTRSVSSVSVISHSTCSAIPELVRCRQCQSYNILLTVPFQNSFGVVSASHITFYLQCHSRTRSVSPVPVISHSTYSAIPELVRCRPCQSYHILLAVPFQNSFGVVRASHITFYLQCHYRTRSVPSVPVISHSTCSAIT